MEETSAWILCENIEQKIFAKNMNLREKFKKKSHYNSKLSHTLNINVF